MQASNRLYKSEVRGSVSRVKTPCEQGLPHCTYVLQAEQRLPSATEEKAKRSFPMERDPLPSTTLRVIRSARSGLGQRSFRSFLCPTPKVTPRSSLGDVGEARWPLSHRWTDTSPNLPVRHTIAAIKAAWCHTLRRASSRRASDSASCERFITACSNR